MYCVVFNGPPQCGKDTLAQMLVEHMDSRITLPVKQASLSMPLRQITYGALGLQGVGIEGPDYEAFKLTVFPALGITGRQFMIDASEKFLKPNYGESIMANLFIEQQRRFDGLVLVRDGGFQIEVDRLIREYGSDHVYVVNVFRDGYDFSNDSREWVFHRESKCRMAVPNDGTLDDLRTEAGRIYGRLVNQMGWVL